MNVFDVILNNLDMYEELVIFVGTLLWGDETVYFLSFLSGLGIVHFYNVLIFGFLGNAGCDVFWFCVAKYSFFPKLIKKISGKKNKKDAKKIVEKDRKHPFLILILSKFFMGTRTVTLFYLANKKKMTFKRFLAYNSLAVAIWISFVSTILFLVGKYASIAFSDVGDVIKIINFLVIFVVGSILFYKFILPKILSRVSQNLNKK